MHFISYQPCGDLATLNTRRQHDYVISELSKGDFSKGIIYTHTHTHTHSLGKKEMMKPVLYRNYFLMTLFKDVNCLVCFAVFTGQF